MKRKIYEKRDWLYAFLACMACMITLNADLSGISVDTTGSLWDLLSLFLKKTEYVLSTFSYKDGIMAFFIFYFFLHTKEGKQPKLSCMAWRIPAALTSFFLVFGCSFRYTNSWDLVFMDTFHMVMASIMMAGFYVLFERIYGCLTGYLVLYGEQRERVPGKVTVWILDRHSFIGPFLVILICWLPYIIAKYPGAAMPETLAEIRQYYWNDINNYYPPLHTIVVSLVMELGNVLHSYTQGFFLNLILQLGLLLAAFSYGFVLMNRWQTPYLFRYLALVIICVVQFFPMEATVVEKDVPYAACVIFLVLLLFEWTRTMQSERVISRWNVLGMILVCMGVACSRNEGIYLVLLAGVATAIYTYRTLWKQNHTKCVRILTAVLLPVFLFFGYQNILLPACGVTDNGPQEALSIPFQQTARYVRDYGYELTPEDEEILSRVLD